MYRIVYSSWSRRTLLDSDVLELARDAAARNDADGVTGLLLYDRYRFIQALEGKEAIVRATMARIEADDRHHRLHIISRLRIDRREFGDWGLNYKRAEGDGTTSSFVAGVKADVGDVRNPILKAAFIGFATLAGNLSSHRLAV